MNEPEPDLLAPLRESPKPPPVPPGRPHPRDLAMEEAGGELFVFVKEWAERNQLKPMEMFYLLTVLMRGHMQAVILANREVGG